MGGMVIGGLGAPELTVFLLFVAVGTAIGAKKNRTLFGLLISVLLGPIGWVIVLLMPNNFPKCHACKGDVIAGATKCKNCGSDLPALNA